MATFVQGVTDEFGPILPYQPNWEFLDKVYGTKQMEYERGFSALKNVYNSLLNSSLTNSENEQFRKDMFRKMQNSLRNTASMDLSDPRIVQKAVKIMDPVSQDEELLYDMHVTRFHQKQKQIMDQYKNSTDPKMRAMYSKYAEQDINFAELDLRQAKRGDGSIRQVQPREFVPFEDVNEYLRQAAKESGLEIVFEEAQGGYIIKHTNGQSAILHFAEWAEMTMGNRFDRQYEVIGRVEAESRVRNLVEKTGMSKSDAIQLVVKDFTPVVKSESEKEVEESSMRLASVDDQITYYEKLYANGFPPDKPEIKQKYIELLNAKEASENVNQRASQHIKGIEEQGEQYTAANLHNLLAYYSKKQSAFDWAESTALATQAIEIKPDQVWLTKAQIASREREGALNRAAEMQRHRENMNFKMWKHEQDQSLAIRIAKNKGELPDEQHLNYFLNSGKDDHYFGVDVLNEVTAKSRTQLFNNVFSNKDGLIVAAVLKNDKRDSYVNVINKVKKFADTGEGKFTKEELALLKEYQTLVGVRSTFNPNSQQAASFYLDNLTARTYQKASQNMEHLALTGTDIDKNLIPAFRNTIAQTRTIYDQRKSIITSHRSINKIITDGSGNLLPAYKDAVRLGTFADGTPIYDLSNVPDAHRQHVSKSISSDFTNRANPVGNTYNFTGVTPGEIYNLVTSTNSIINSTGKLTGDVLKNLNPTDLLDLFGNNLRVSYDPGNKKAYVELNPILANQKAKQLGVKAGEVVKIEIPYATLNSYDNSMQRFNKYASHNSVNLDPMGLFEIFSNDFNTSVSAPDHFKNVGFDYKITGTTDRNGKQGLVVRIKAKEPGSNNFSDLDNKFFEINKSDPQSFVDLNNYINAMYENYIHLRTVYNKK